MNDMTNIAIPQQCEYSFHYDESTLLQSEPITILDILNTRWERDVVTVSGKILHVKDQRQVGSPHKQLNLMEAVLGDVRATIPLDLWESQIDKVQQGKLIKVYIFQPVPKDSFRYVFLNSNNFLCTQYLSSPLK